MERGKERGRRKENGGERGKERVRGREGGEVYREIEKKGERAWILCIHFNYNDFS